MTPHQKRVFEVVKARLDRDGLAPTYEEIQAELGLSSKSAVARAVDALVEEGRLVKRIARARGLAIPRVNLTDVSTADLVAELEKRGWRRG